MKEKRVVSVLVPYKWSDNEVLVYLQKRAKDVKRLPDWFGFFGGGRENQETPEATLLREIKEELDYTPQGYQFFGQYDFPDQLYFTYYVEVNDDFELQITILEGEYGKWFSENDIITQEKLIPADRTILKDLLKQLRV